jgi:hypothetical protein
MYTDIRERPKVDNIIGDCRNEGKGGKICRLNWRKQAVKDKMVILTFRAKSKKKEGRCCCVDFEVGTSICMPIRESRKNV